MAKRGFLELTSGIIRTGLLASFLAALMFAISPGVAQTSSADMAKSLVAAANARASVHVRYDGSYVRIVYPGGDVPSNTGACTYEIIRIYRSVGIDLQKEVHEDIARNFSAYPTRRMWGRMSPDANIDHRRVPNLMTYFERQHASQPITQRAEDYLPGDVVAWDLGRGLTHIGMVVDGKALLSGRHKVLHNIGNGPQIEDVLFDWKIIGHYRFYRVVVRTT